MSNKKKGGGGGGGDGGGWQKDDDEIQAIVIADSFNRMFTPITYECPRALLPMGNKVILDYTLEYLVEENIQEIIVFCCSIGDKIREHVEKNWSAVTKCKIHCVMSTDCLCLGDALREIDLEGLIRSDFILIHGDVISNVKLTSVIREHKEKRKKEKNLVMTMLHRKASPGHFTRSTHDDCFLIVERESEHILFHQKSHACPKLMFPTNLLANRKDITIYYDLADCNIYVCSPQVAPLFTDNFDYQTLDDFVKGILVNEEIMGDHIRSCVISRGYSGRINDLHMYNAITLDLMNRWIYPLIPDNRLHMYKRNNVYLQSDVTVGRDCIINESVMIGKGSCIGESSQILKSVIGVNCKIGDNVIIKNSYLWDNCIVEDNVSITQSIVCSGACVRRCVNLIDSIVSYNVCVGSDMNVPPLTRLSLLKRDDIDEQFDQMAIDDSKDVNNEYDILIVGDDGKGYLWPFDTEEEDCIPSLTGNNYESSDSESSDDDDGDDDYDDDDPAYPEYSNLEQFEMEVVENLRSGIAENIAIDNIALEINASKFKFNISISELSQTIVRSLLQLAVKDEERTKQDIAKDLDKIIKDLYQLLVKYLSNVEEQIHAVTAAEDYFSKRLQMGGIFATFLHKLYDSDILDETVILKWYNSPIHCEDQTELDNYKQLRSNQILCKLITWLQEADEEDSEEDS